MAVTGTETSAITLETGSTDRLANMHEFARTALELLLNELSR
jgi:nicotinamide-nucleotide amidase